MDIHSLLAPMFRFLRYRFNTSNITTFAKNSKRKMICACKLSNGLNLGDGVVLKGAFIGPGYPANAPGRERIAGYEITRNVPDHVWERFASSAGAILANKLVFGPNDETALSEFCWQNARVRGWMQAPHSM